MKRFTTLTARAVPLMIDDIDTDAIFPARFAKTTADSGFGDCAFAELRFRDGQPVADFALNRPEHAGAQILITGDNFGCGSSREHAVWALRDFGFRAILAPGFADIFHQNCFRNGVLPVTLPRTDINDFARMLQRDPATALTIDLEQNTLTAGDRTVNFQTAPRGRDMLLRGLDEVGLTLESRDEISAFARNHFARYPWLNLG